ncbi:MAG: hypothetical protein HYR84_09265 [Planctomycetes bacterium]|nr:hypothetical protein [Planctomycetota bacterium]
MVGRIVEVGLFALSFALFVLAGYCYLNQPDAPGALVDKPDQELSAAPIGKREVRYRLENPTGHPVRVVGFSFC